MHKGFAYSLFTLGLSMALTGHALAFAIAPEKIKSYADIYPEFFQASMIQNAAYRPASSKSEAVTLLMNSFNGDTDVDELSAVLRPSDMSSSVIKPDSQIKKLLSTKGLQWKDYMEITHTLATDQALFTHFMGQLDQAKVQKNVVSRAAEDPTFIAQIASLDQQVIVRNLLKSYKSK
jgi:hypothetical protein